MPIRVTHWAIILAVLFFVCGARAALIGHWTLDEKSGTVATDSSGRGHHGTYINNPGLGVPGALDTGTGMNSATGYMVADLGGDLPTGAEERTIALWLKPVTNNIDRKFLAYGSTAQGGAFSFTIEPVNSVMGVRLRHYGGNFTYPGVKLNEWNHLTLLVPPGSTLTSHVRVYINGTNSPGTMTSSPDRNLVTGTSRFFVGTVHDSPGSVFDGVFDDVWFFDHALTVEEIAAVMAGESGELASSPAPQDGATDVPRGVVLGWTAGDFATAHDVYVGTALEVVKAANRANPANVLLSRGQAATTFAPTGLQYGRTYYWRVDEVNAPPDSTIFKGDVWSFTVEPYAYPIKNVKATASSAQAGMAAQNTVNGSGLNAGDQHATEPMTMWLSDGTLPNWIQYEFDQAYKLHELWVWNSNQAIEAFIGFGAKAVTIEYSLDGSTWTALPGVPEFTRATGTPAYTANTTVPLGGVAAQYVKLTINTTWGGLPRAGLSEVRFFYAPVQARGPAPADAVRSVALDATLSWRPGREAASHHVYLGTDKAAVVQGTTPARKVAEPAYIPGPLHFGTTYYWRVDEVNTVNPVNEVTYPGAVWSFTTQEYAIVEDFETYSDKQGEEVFSLWTDGMVNGNGSIVGLYPDAVNGTFCETTIIHGGKQSMPFEYNNVKAPYYSEAERTFDKPQDWTGNGADTLTVYFRGNPAAFAEAAGKITLSGGGTDIWNTADQFRFAFKPLTGDGTLVAKVESVVNTDPWAKVGVMIRESLDPGARFAAVYATPGNGVRYQARLQSAVAATSDTAVATPEQIALRAPVWIKVERKGSAFSCFYSTNGTQWTSMSWNPQTINMTAATVYLGLVASSHNVNAPTAAVFSGISTTGNVPGAWQVQAIGAAQPANDAAPLYLVVQDSAGKSKTITHPDPAATTQATWHAWQIPFDEISPGGVKLTAVKKLVLGVGDRANPKAGGAGKLYLDDIGFGHPGSAN